MNRSEQTPDVQCHWQKETSYRCQMFGTRGYTDDKGSAWYCTLHREEVLGNHSPQLAHYELFQDWVFQAARFYPDSQWDGDPQEIWERLHGTGIGVGVINGHKPSPSDGDLPTREELNKIRTKLKPGLYGEVLREQAEHGSVMPEKGSRNG